MNNKIIHWFIRAIVIILVFIMLQLLFACSTTKIVHHNGQYIITNVTANICYSSKVKLNYTEQFMYNGLKEFYFESSKDTILTNNVPWKGEYRGYYSGSAYSKPFYFQIEFPANEKEKVITIITPYKNLIVGYKCYKK